jgi:hypothetical protein
LQVERVGTDNGRTSVTLRVENRSNEPVSFLTRNDRPDLFSLTDDKGHDYSNALDLMSVDPQLIKVEPGAKVTGTFQLLKAVDADASGLQLTLKEYEGHGRKFPLRSLKLVESQP